MSAVTQRIDPAGEVFQVMIEAARGGSDIIRSE